MANEEYDVFISYSRKDYVDENDKVIPGNVVSKIKDCLSAAGISYWFDEEGIYYGDTFTEKIPANIEKSKVFLFLASVNSNQSKWTSKEIGCAENMEKRIIPVRIDKSPYNKSVMFRIADLDYVKYYSNPDKGLDDIVDAVKKALKDIEDEERRIKEEEERKKERNKGDVKKNKKDVRKKSADIKQNRKRQ
ncbi:MAG: toll/interleukin-1 receptor domain-containing protein [Bacteroidales bacterium]|nr:toll/interleukin-1 receptor domain-containing protein [Bacteroidales bacterium]